MTLKKISEQILSLLNGGDSPVAAKVEIIEVKEAVIQVVNSLLKTQHFTTTLGAGEMTPDGLVLAEYENVAVESFKGVSRVALPAMPYSLPLNIGIFQVNKAGEPHNPHIPMMTGQIAMIGEEPLISEVLGQYAYEVRGKYIVYNRDLTELGTTTVDMLLAVKDISLYTDTEMLPIPSDMEAEVIEKTYALFTGQLPANKKVDVLNKEATK